MHPIAFLYASVALATARLQQPRTAEHTGHKISRQISAHDKVNDLMQSGKLENLSKPRLTIDFSADHHSSQNFQQNGSKDAFIPSPHEAASSAPNQRPLVASNQMSIFEKQKDDFTISNLSKTLPFPSGSVYPSDNATQTLLGGFSAITLARQNEVFERDRDNFTLYKKFDGTNDTDKIFTENTLNSSLRSENNERNISSIEKSEQSNTSLRSGIPLALDDENRGNGNRGQHNWTKIQEASSEGGQSHTLIETNVYPTQVPTAQTPEKTSDDSKFKAEFTSGNFKGKTLHSRHTRQAKTAPFRSGRARPTPTSIQVSFFREQVQKLPTPIRNRLEAIYKRIGFTQEFQTLLMREVVAAKRDSNQNEAQRRNLEATSLGVPRKDGIGRFGNTQLENQGVSIQKRYGIDNNRQTNSESDRPFAARANSRGRYSVSFDRRPIRHGILVGGKTNQSGQRNGASPPKGLRQNLRTGILTSGAQQTSSQRVRVDPGLTSQQMQMISSLDELTRTRVVDLYKSIGNSERFRATIDRLYRNQLVAANEMLHSGNQGSRQSSYMPIGRRANPDPNLLEVRLMQQELDIIDQQKRLLERQQKLAQQQQVHLQQHQKQRGENQQSGQQRLMQQQGQTILQGSLKQNHHQQVLEQRQNLIQQNPEKQPRFQLKRQRQQQRGKYRVQQERRLQTEQQRLQQRHFQQNQMLLQGQRQENRNFQLQTQRGHQIKQPQLQQNLNHLNNEHPIERNPYSQINHAPHFQGQQTQINGNIYNRALADTRAVQTPLSSRGRLSGKQEIHTHRQQPSFQGLQESAFRASNDPESMLRQAQSKLLAAESNPRYIQNDIPTQVFGGNVQESINLTTNSTSPRANGHMELTDKQSNIHIHGEIKSHKIGFSGNSNNWGQNQTQPYLQRNEQQQQQRQHEYNPQLQQQKNQENLYHTLKSQSQARVPLQNQTSSLKENEQQKIHSILTPHQQQVSFEQIHNRTQRPSLIRDEKHQQQISIHSTPEPTQQKLSQHIQRDQQFGQLETTTPKPAQIDMKKPTQKSVAQQHQQQEPQVPLNTKDFSSSAVPTPSPLIKVFNTSILIPDHINKNPIMREAFINVIIKAKIEAEIRNRFKSMSIQKQSTNLKTQPSVPLTAQKLASESTPIIQLPSPTQNIQQSKSVSSPNRGLSNTQQVSKQKEEQYQPQLQIQQQDSQHGLQNQYIESHGEPVLNNTENLHHSQGTTPPPKPRTRALDLTVELVPALFLTWALEEPQITALEGSNIEDILRTIATTIDRTMHGESKTSSSISAAMKKAEQFRAFLIDTLIKDPLSYSVTNGNVHQQTYYERLDRGPSVLIKELREGFIKQKQISRSQRLLDLRKRRKREAITKAVAAQIKRKGRGNSGDFNGAKNKLLTMNRDHRTSKTVFDCDRKKSDGCNTLRFEVKNQKESRRVRRNVGRLYQSPRFPILRFIWLLPKGTFPTNPGETIEYIMKKFSPTENSVTPSATPLRNYTTPSPTLDNLKPTAQSMTILQPSIVSPNNHSHKKTASEPGAVDLTVSRPINRSSVSMLQKLKDSVTPYAASNRDNNNIPISIAPTTLPLSISTLPSSNFAQQQNLTMSNTILSPGMITHSSNFSVGQMAVLLGMLSGAMHPSHVTSFKSRGPSITNATPLSDTKRLQMHEVLAQNLHHQQPQLNSLQKFRFGNVPNTIIPTALAIVQKELYTTTSKKAIPTQSNLVTPISELQKNKTTNPILMSEPASVKFSHQDILAQYELFKKWRRLQQENAIKSRPSQKQNSFLDPNLPSQDYKEGGNHQPHQYHIQRNQSEIKNAWHVQTQQTALPLHAQVQNEMHQLSQGPHFHRPELQQLQQEQQQQKPQQLQSQDLSPKIIEQSMFEVRQLNEAGDKNILGKQQNNAQNKHQQYEQQPSQLQRQTLEQTMEHSSHITQATHQNNNGVDHQENGVNTPQDHSQRYSAQKTGLHGILRGNRQNFQHLHQNSQLKPPIEKLNFGLMATQSLQHSPPTPSNHLTHPLISSLSIQHPDIPRHTLSSLLKTILKQTAPTAGPTVFPQTNYTKGIGKEENNLSKTTIPTYGHIYRGPTASSENLNNSKPTGNVHILENSNDGWRGDSQFLTPFPTPDYSILTSENQLNAQSQYPVGTEAVKYLTEQPGYSMNTQSNQESKTTIPVKSVTTPTLSLESNSRTPGSSSIPTLQYSEEANGVNSTNTGSEPGKEIGKLSKLLQGNQQEMIPSLQSSSDSSKHIENNHHKQHNGEEWLSKPRVTRKGTSLLDILPTQMPLAYPSSPLTTAAIFSNRYITFNIPREKLATTPPTIQDTDINQNKRNHNSFQLIEEDREFGTETSPTPQSSGLSNLPQQTSHYHGDVNNYSKVPESVMGRDLSSISHVQTSLTTDIKGFPDDSFKIKQVHENNHENGATTGSIRNNRFDSVDNRSGRDKEGSIGTSVKENIPTEAVHLNAPDTLVSSNYDNFLLSTPVPRVPKPSVKKVAFLVPNNVIPTVIPEPLDQFKLFKPVENLQINTDPVLIADNVKKALEASRISKNTPDIQTTLQSDTLFKTNFLPSKMLTTLQNRDASSNQAAVRENLQIQESSSYTQGHQVTAQNRQNQPLQVQQRFKSRTSILPENVQDVKAQGAQQLETQHQFGQPKEKRLDEHQQLLQPLSMQKQTSVQIDNEQVEMQHKQGEYTQTGTASYSVTDKVAQRPAEPPTQTTLSPFEDYWKFLIWQSKLMGGQKLTGPTTTTPYKPNTRNPGFLNAPPQPLIQTTTLAATTTTSTTTTPSTIPPPRCYCAPTRPSARLNQFCLTRCDVTIGTCSSALCRCSCSAHHGSSLPIPYHLPPQNPMNSQFLTQNNVFGHMLPRLPHTTPPPLTRENYNAIDSLGFAISAVEPSSPPQTQQLEPPSSFSDLAQMSESRFNRFMNFMAGKNGGEKSSGDGGGGGAKEVEPDR